MPIIIWQIILNLPAIWSTIKQIIELIQSLRNSGDKTQAKAEMVNILKETAQTKSVSPEQHTRLQDLIERLKRH